MSLGSFILPMGFASTLRRRSLPRARNGAGGLWAIALLQSDISPIANLAPQRLHGFRFSENGMTQGASGISAFRRFFDEKDNLVHLVRARRPLTLPRISTIRRSFSRILSASSAGGRCVMSSLARGFFRSRLQPVASSSAAATFQARSFSSRLFHHVT